MLGLLKHNRARIAFTHDVIMAALSFPLSLYLRMGDGIFIFAGSYLLRGTIIFTLIAAVVFLTSRLYKGIWRYASIDDLVAMTKAVTLIVLIFLPLMFIVGRLESVPRSLPLINWFVLLAMLGGPRFLYRVMKDRGIRKGLLKSPTKQVPILLVGAGDGAELFLRELRRDANTPYYPVGILDETGGRVGREIHNVPVLGTVEDIQDVLKKCTLAPQKLVITKENLDGALVRRVMEKAEAHGLTVSRAPKLTELRGGLESDRLEIKPVAVEDLLGRPQQPLDREAMKALVRGRRVLITGAGGTIGSELVNQIADSHPSHLFLFDASEYQLYQIDMAMAEKHPDLPREAVLGDVRDKMRVQDTMQRLHPQLVFHAAALKHVPMVEANPLEGVQTNALGSRIVADACRAAGVDCMVQISTDKVVNPTNVMGATKRVAESYIQALDPVSRAEGGTRYVVVRFGNVLGSTGSVVPLFRRQLQAGGPLTVTHPEVTRYFMTVREAVELVLQAAVVGTEDADAAGRIFVLDMGQPIKVLDLARQMIQLAGLQPDKDIQIKFTGLRPGEKLYEELLHGGEAELPTRAPGMTLAAPRTGNLKDLQSALDALEKAARAGQRDTVLRIMTDLVPEYTPDPGTMAPVAPDHVTAEHANSESGRPQTD
ncbi:MAG: nucleotide sugar dehydratase [Rhodospirillaceae bacterium]|nr:nucleotide sugar dehydratase [Rhodospirillaceae bacterium]MAX63832.1 nucleotide sugar dehydratase [Rhodospirillaceae bacterium]MBB57266.1 nucleotide sugar dehydratase [Rhodospirillaceae bacterium]|tara:strand:- start:40313 stop:42277 length:1965 start_codon:yes stop_codon:yes gene_type:complete